MFQNNINVLLSRCIYGDAKQVLAYTSPNKGDCFSPDKVYHCVCHIPSVALIEPSHMLV